MLERILSPRGYKIYFAFFIAMLGYALWLWFTNSGIVGWIDRFQAQHLFSGYYYPEMTILVLVIPMLAISFGAGFLYDFLTSGGIFSNRENTSDFANPDSNSRVDYRETNRKELIDQVRSRHQEQINQLKSLGFEELGFYREIVPWFGMPMGFIGILGAIGVLANEITRMGPNLTVNGFYISMSSRRDSAYASISKLGINFYNSFSDGTCLVSSSYKGSDFQDESQKLYKIAAPRSIESTWKDHQQRVNRFLAEGKVIREDVSMANYFSIVKRIDEYMLRHHGQISRKLHNEPPFLSMVTSTTLSTIGAMGVLLSCFLVLASIFSIVRDIYPGCWFLRNFVVPPLPLELAGLLGCMAISWILARLQNNLFTIDGIGTRLYGEKRIPDSQQFTSTKWLALPGVPILPVRSYIITLEAPDVWGKRAFRMEPLNAIDWEQVKETIRKSWLGYGIFILICIALTLWPILECR